MLTAAANFDLGRQKQQCKDVLLDEQEEEEQDR